MSEERERVAEVMREINRAWRAGRIDDLEPMLHEQVTMALPGFVGSVQGRDKLLAGFRDFSENAVVHAFDKGEEQIDVVGSTAVVSSTWEMVYERSGERYRASGRDVWVFEKRDGTWRAVWRTMLDVAETPA